MDISSYGTQFIEEQEGYEETVYKDSAGLPTVGIGHLLSADEKARWPVGTKLDAKTCDALFDSDNNSAITCINNHVKVPINQNQFDALFSLVFNIGNSAFQNSTLLKKLNAQDYPGAADQFLVWNKITVNGQKVVSQGLADRRERERNLFLEPEDEPIEVN